MPSLNYWTGTAWQPVWGGGTVASSEAKSGSWAPNYTEISTGNFRQGTGKYFWTPGTDHHLVVVQFEIQVPKADIEALDFQTNPLLTIEGCPFSGVLFDDPQSPLAFLPAQAHVAYRDDRNPSLQTVRCYFQPSSKNFLVFDLYSLSVEYPLPISLVGSAIIQTAEEP